MTLENIDILQEETLDLEEIVTDDFKVICVQNNEVVAYGEWQGTRGNVKRLEEWEPLGYKKTNKEYILGYDNKWYIKGEEPQRPLDEIKELKKAEINSERDNARQTEGAEYDGDIFDIDEVSQSNILAQIKVAEIIGDPKATYTYRSKTNTDHLLTLAQLQELGLAIAVKVNAIYVKSWDLKAQVDKATTAEEVEAIKWTSA